jgi:hypothetical protein
VGMPKGLREVAGQLIYDKPWHCSLCRRRYKRRVLVHMWDKVLDSKRGFRWVPSVVRLCVSDDNVVGCVEMGLRKLFERSRRGKTETVKHA